MDGSNEYDQYSTTETKTNKVWIDGKPIYRKVFPINITSGVGGILVVNFRGTHNLSTLIDLHTICVGNNNAVDITNYYNNANDMFRIFLDESGNFYFVRGSNYPSLPVTGYLIAEYTKTTN